MNEPDSHPPRSWRSTHDNGWQSWIGARDDGTYAAWVCEPDSAIIARHREDFKSAEAAATWEIQQVIGHVCGPSCLRWIDDAPGGS
jgi:hypothetical protein